MRLRRRAASSRTGPREPRRTASQSVSDSTSRGMSTRSCNATYSAGEVHVRKGARSASLSSEEKSGQPGGTACLRMLARLVERGRVARARQGGVRARPAGAAAAVQPLLLAWLRGRKRGGRPERGRSGPRLSQRGEGAGALRGAAALSRRQRDAAGGEQHRSQQRQPGGLQAGQVAPPCCHGGRKQWVQRPPVGLSGRSVWDSSSTNSVDVITASRSDVPC